MIKVVQHVQLQACFQLRVKENAFQFNSIQFNSIQFNSETSILGQHGHAHSVFKWMDWPALTLRVKLKASLGCTATIWKASFGQFT